MTTMLNARQEVSCSSLRLDVLVLFFLLPLQAQALEITPPSGLQQIGKVLKLESRLENLPQGTESQLRSGCLKAGYRPMEVSHANWLDSASTEVAVEFEPESRSGGLLQFRSHSPVNHAIVELQLVSNCPLLVFEAKWSLLLEESVDEVTSAFEREKLQGRSRGTFDPKNSSLLEISRREPLPVEKRHALIPTTAIAEVKKNIAPEGQVEPRVSTAEKAIEVALLDDGGLYPDMQETAAPYAVGALPAQPGNIRTQAYQEVSFWQQLILPVSSGLLLLMGAALGLYQFRARRLTEMKNKSGLAPWLADQAEDAKATESDLAVHTDAPARQPTDVKSGRAIPFSATEASSPLVIESLLGKGYDDHHEDEHLVAVPYGSNPVDSAARSTLDQSLDLLHKADLRNWDLPLSYKGIVEERNKALEASRTPEAMLLRCHVGLVELAFQDAIRGQATSLEDAGALADSLLGANMHDAGLPASLCLPDLVKSLIRSKLCEISGADQLHSLRNNLLSLGTHQVGAALCFSMPEWREFLDQEGVIGRGDNTLDAE